MVASQAQRQSTDCGSEVVNRMSLNIEDLEWRIKNNLDFPVEIIHTSNIQVQKPSSNVKEK